MTDGRPRRRSIFSGVLLILLGVLFLYHNFAGGLRIWHLFSTWWPVLLILWGLAKLFDHMVARRTGQVAPSAISGGDIFLIFVAVLLVASIGFVDVVRPPDRPGGFRWPPWSQEYSFAEELPTKSIPAESTITLNTDYGDISVHGEETPALRVVIKKVAAAGSEDEAKRLAGDVGVEIAEAGGGYQVSTRNQGSRVEVDLETHVPKQASVTARTSRGEAQVSGVAGNVNVEAQRGDIDVRDTGGGVSAEIQRGDAHIIGIGNNVKLSGRGGQIEIADVKGDAVVDGEFYGPIRFEKVGKGARFVSRRTDLTVSQLSGRLEIASGRMQITDAPGNLSLVTSKFDLMLENIGGRISVRNRDGDVTLRLAQAPRDNIEIESASGSIEVVLPSKSSFEISAESRNGEIENEFGDTGLKSTGDDNNRRLEGKVGSRGPQIRLKTTYGTIRIRRGA